MSFPLSLLGGGRIGRDCVSPLWRWWVMFVDVGWLERCPNRGVLS